MALTKPSRGMLDTGISDSSDATALTFDSSEDATFTGHIVLADNKKIKFGNSTDYHISHNANGVTYVAGSVVEHNANTWRIKNLAGTESIINALADGAVTLYHNNAAKLATAADGIDVTGHIDAATITTTGAGTIGGNLTVTGNLQVDGTTTTINSTTYTVDDLNITLASGAGSSSAADGAGLTIDGASATWNYVHSNTSWTSNKPVRAERFLTTTNNSSNFYSLLATRSGSGTGSPDLYGDSNTLVLGTSSSDVAVAFTSSAADFQENNITTTGSITSTGSLSITGAISSGADTTIASFGRAGSAVSSSIIYADATTDMEFGTTTSHALSLITADTRRLTIDNSGNATFSANLIVNGNTTLGNADSDTVTIPGPVAVDTDTLYVDVTNDRVGINVGTSPSNALSVSGVITSGNFSSVGVGGTPGDANTAELGPGYLNLARDDTADAKQILFGKNGAVHSYLETTSGGLNIGGGNVGINDTNADRKVSIIGDSTSNGQYPLSLDATNTDYTLEFRRNGTSEWWIKQASSSFNIHENGSGDHFRIATGGVVGIGTTDFTNMGSSSYKGLKVGGAVLQDSGGGNGSATWLGNNAYVGASNNFYFDGGGNASGIQMTTGDINFYTFDGGGGSADAQWSPTARMHIKENGYIGIGTTSPVERLQVEGKIYVPSSQVQAGTALIGELSGHAMFGSNSSAEPIMIARDFSASYPDITVATGGQVGIGTTSVLSFGKLNVAGGIRFTHSPASAAGLNVVGQYSYNNSNTDNACGSVYYKMFMLNFYHNNGHSQCLFLANGGGGVGYRFTVIEPGSNTIRNGIIDFSFTTIGSSPNTFRVKVGNGNGNLTVSRTSGTGSFQISVQVLSGG